MESALLAVTITLSVVFGIIMAIGIYFLYIRRRVDGSGFQTPTDPQEPKRNTFWWKKKKTRAQPNESVFPPFLSSENGTEKTARFADTTLPSALYSSTFGDAGEFDLETGWGAGQDLDTGAGCPPQAQLPRLGAEPVVLDISTRVTRNIRELDSNTTMCLMFYL